MSVIVCKPAGAAGRGWTLGAPESEWRAVERRTDFPGAGRSCRGSAGAEVPRRGSGEGGSVTRWIAALIAIVSSVIAAATLSAAAGEGGSSEARLVFVGDTGTGNERARAVRDAILGTVEAAGASHLFLLGDNVYENGEAAYIAPRFVDIYRPVLRFLTIHAALGNHDVQKCRGTERRPVPRDASAYEPGRDCWAADHLATSEFGYREGSRYYTVAIPGVAAPLVQVFVLDTNTLGDDQTRIDDGADHAQLAWLEAALGASSARWRVVAMHHPIHSPTRRRFFFGRRGPDDRLRAQLEPLFIEHGVDIVFQGHQHLYARPRPQRGVRYIVSGGGSKSPDAFEPDDETNARRDRGKFNHFVYVRAAGDRFEYCVIDDERRVRDGGWFAAGDPVDTVFPAGTCPAIG